MIADKKKHTDVLAERFRYDSNMKPDLGKLQSLLQGTRIATDVADKNDISVHKLRHNSNILLTQNGYRKQTELLAMLIPALS